MEPSNLNPPPDRDDARLEALLRGSSPPLPDDGFSARVLCALPPPVRKSIRLSRTPLCFAGAALGTLVALLGNASGPQVTETWASVVAAFAPVSERLFEPTVLAALAVALGSALYALWPSLRRTTA